MKKRKLTWRILLMTLFALILLILLFDLFYKYQFNKNVERYKAEEPPMITWVDDDGYLEFYTKLYPMALKHGITMTSAIISNRDHGNGRLYSLDQAREMVENGMEIVNHGYWHNKNYRPGNMSKEDLVDDYVMSKAFAADNGFKGNIHVYPFGSIDGYVKEVAPQHFDFAVTTLPGAVPKPFNRYELPRINAWGSQPLDKIYKALDQGKENVSWVILMTHVNQRVEYDEEFYESIILYAKEQGYVFVTLEEGFNKYKQFERSWYGDLKASVKEKLDDIFGK